MATKEENLKYRHKLTLDEHNRLIDRQNGRCAVCGGNNVLNRALYVDHNHETGFIRGLLCVNCNAVLGHAKDNVYILLKMI